MMNRGGRRWKTGARKPRPKKDPQGALFDASAVEVRGAEPWTLRDLTFLATDNEAVLERHRYLLTSLLQFMHPGEREDAGRILSGADARGRISKAEAELAGVIETAALKRVPPGRSYGSERRARLAAGLEP